MLNAHYGGVRKYPRGCSLPTAHPTSSLRARQTLDSCLGPEPGALTCSQFFFRKKLRPWAPNLGGTVRAVTREGSQSISGAAATDGAPTMHWGPGQELPSITLGTLSIPVCM